MSDPGQHTDNQLSDLLAWADRGALEVIVTYLFQESAWKGGHQKQPTQVYRAAFAFAGRQAEVREFCKLLARILRRRGSEDMAPHEPNAVNTNSRNPNF